MSFEFLSVSVVILKYKSLARLTLLWLISSEIFCVNFESYAKKRFYIQVENNSFLISKHFFVICTFYVYNLTFQIIMYYHTLYVCVCVWYMYQPLACQLSPNVSITSKKHPLPFVSVEKKFHHFPSQTCFSLFSLLWANMVSLEC